MAQFPPAPKRENDVFFWAKDMHSFIRSITPSSQRTSGGTFWGVTGKNYDNFPYHFEVIYDFAYVPSSTERRLAVRGGTWSRAAWEVNKLEITAPAGASPDFAAAGGPTIDDLAIATSTMADQDVWIIYAALYDDVTVNDWSPINPSDMVLKAEKGTVAAPPSDPIDPDPDNRANWMRILCTVTNDAGTLTFDQHWRSGNIKDFQLIPDGDPMNTSTTPRGASLNYVETGDMAGHLQISGFDGLTTDATDDGKALYANVSGGDGTVYYAHPATLAGDPYVNGTGPGTGDLVSGLTSIPTPTPPVSPVTGYATIPYAVRSVTVDDATIDISASTPVSTAYVAVTIDPDDIPTGTVYHNELDFTNPTPLQDPRLDAEDLYDHDYRHAILGGTYNKTGSNGAWFASIGYDTNTYTLASPELRIGLERNELYDINEAISADCTDRQLHEPGGNVVYDWDLEKAFDDTGANTMIDHSTYNAGILGGDWDVNDGSIALETGEAYIVNNEQVISDRLAAVADVAGATTGTATNNGYGFVSAAEFNAFVATVAEIKAQFNTWLARARIATGHGLIA